MSRPMSNVRLSHLADGDLEFPPVAKSARL